MWITSASPTPTSGRQSNEFPNESMNGRQNEMKSEVEICSLEKQPYHLVEKGADASRWEEGWDELGLQLECSTGARPPHTVTRCSLRVCISRSPRWCWSWSGVHPEGQVTDNWKSSTSVRIGPDLGISNKGGLRTQQTGGLRIKSQGATEAQISSRKWKHKGLECRVRRWYIQERKGTCGPLSCLRNSVNLRSPGDRNRESH